MKSCRSTTLRWSGVDVGSHLEKQRYNFEAIYLHRFLQGCSLQSQISLEIDPCPAIDQESNQVRASCVDGFQEGCLPDVRFAPSQVRDGAVGIAAIVKKFPYHFKVGVMALPTEFDC